MSNERCPVCGGKNVTFVTSVNNGRGQYRCRDCDSRWVTSEPFVEITNEESGILTELAFGNNREVLAEELVMRREFAEGRASEFRDLTGAALETGAAARHFDEEKVEALYERLSSLLFPESYESD